ncbi:hypothetical protein [Chamaesiphon minutus]|uniref:Uncharacterized protein n=1 Tax=Chamaesiphon minutus (strain ATCC 27169 / PCC 6605) TaxID=1173020 RepID=K9UGC0_CHAP6|nr:hypothetical protein [Chamaesiphon minutus]AFY93471.1 hypothetical protein Cha6605_2412 [Chamaesiphon minutus PCC 6605]
MDSTTSISYSKNHWRTTRRGRTIADWLFFLPYPKSEKEVQNMLDLFKSIAAIAEEQDICCISTTETYGLLEVKSYVDYIEKDFLRSQNIYEPLDSNGLPCIEPPDFTTKLAYFNSNNEIIEQYIGNMGSLIAEIYDIEINKDCADPTTAITLDSSPNLEFDKKNHKFTENKVVEVRIELTTDIWFPWIDGAIHAYRPHGEETYLQPVNHPTFGMVYDNRELVSYHTPRLNKFLSESHKIASSYGAKWKLDTTQGVPLYAKMCSTLGVRLD